MLWRAPKKACPVTLILPGRGLVGCLWHAHKSDPCPFLCCPQPDIAEKYLSASEYGVTINGHPEIPETKDGNQAMALYLMIENNTIVGCEPWLSGSTLIGVGAGS